MAHARKQIRDAILAAVTGLPATKRRVHASRVHPVTDGELPCLLIYTRSESSAPITVGTPRRLGCELSVIVQACVKMAEGYDNQLDKIALEVAEAMSNAPSLLALVKNIFLASTEITMAGDAEKPVALMAMNWTATYHVMDDDLETIV